MHAVEKAHDHFLNTDLAPECKHALEAALMLDTHINYRSRPSSHVCGNSYNMSTRWYPRQYKMNIEPLQVNRDLTRKPSSGKTGTRDFGGQKNGHNVFLLVMPAMMIWGWMLLPQNQHNPRVDTALCEWMRLKMNVIPYGHERSAMRCSRVWMQVGMAWMGWCGHKCLLWKRLQN